MRLVGIIAALLVAASAYAGDAVPTKPAPSKTAAPPSTDKQLKPYTGRLVVSPDAPPTQFDEFPKYLKANAMADNSYDVLKGPPWQFHLVAVLAKDPGTKPITLVFADKDDKKLTTMHSVEVRAQKKIVTASSEATVAAGFAADKTYVVRLMQGKTVLAKAQLHLRY
ncbi:MAG TPA: hypothetical protein VIV40_01765 [Kofleriaceae bacterium]|jgi:hypothetical protein